MTPARFASIQISLKEIGVCVLSMTTSTKSTAVQSGCYQFIRVEVVMDSKKIETKPGYCMITKLLCHNPVSEIHDLIDQVIAGQWDIITPKEFGRSNQTSHGELIRQIMRVTDEEK